MNKTFLIGNLTKDVDLRTTQSGKSVASFSIAVNRRFKDKEGEKQTDFFSIIAWGQLGEMCGRYLAKGRKVAVTGRISLRTWEKDGKHGASLEVLAEDVEFLSSRAETPAQPATQVDPASGMEAVEPDDLPF
jgi:single-strand DNA-binding protein